ncbi:mannosyl-oligosaccharide 1,2-alpha-mannosidase IB [Trypanosoma conorhini]|uniref:alpha-1,2-Mannosidase n=1 Tax=Trypanosoma conorhini TaxID=83891 RepID=A0A3R7LX64_9TRYP|nr:mannosyl-oligosaccharide 1,2-alpha-mannosidase IB [Trypanosoma conorhini]RNF22348.1 mannosyl-oligosaccharide 1,2-alpha-mannosidase IB [Trypanosoma conorhini]
MCVREGGKRCSGPAAYVCALAACLLLAAVPVRGDGPGGGAGVRDGEGGSKWRSTDALHPIAAEMRPYVREMIEHAFGSYIKYAFPKDELCPVSGTGKNTMGGYGWTLIDALDTLAVAGLHTEFRRYAKWVEEHVSFDIDVTVSAFETTIRALGGLLAAHFMYEEGVVAVVASEHNYTGGLVRLAADLGNRLLPCFNSSTGIPYLSVNLRHYSSSTWNRGTSTADAGTFLLEMTALSGITGDDRYERAARRASEALFAARSPETGLMGNQIDVTTGKWIGVESHLSGGIDSAIEYFIKSHAMTGDIGDWERFERTVRDVNHYVRKGGMLTTVDMQNGRTWREVHTSLSSFFPGNLILGGHHTEATESSWPIHSIFKHFGALPEDFSLSGADPSFGYPQRPEHAESVYMLYRATHDPAYLVMGRELALAINLRMRTPYGFSTLHNVKLPHRDSQHGDTMESFMIAETLKYLYLLFDECNAVHVQGKPRGGIPPYCAAVESGSSVGSHVGWVFNTEAHLFPNTAEWWGPISVDEAKVEEDVSGETLMERRLEVIDGLIESFHALKRDGKDRGKGNATTHQFYCANHAVNDVERISKSIFR